MPDHVPQIHIREEPNPRGAVNISFQKNSSRKLKYLEAEPKILGMTQIALAFFYTCHVVMMYGNNIAVQHNAVTAGCSVVVIIAGSLGIAAQNLHSSTIKACLGMQLVTCIGSVICFIRHMFDPFFCAMEGPSNPICVHMYPQESFRQLQALQMLVVAVHIAVSATLAIYCCKVIECCSPSSSVPIIIVARLADAD